jgi:MFS family permease
MFNQGGLSLEQAPPISVVLKFFITASLFGLLLGLFLFGNITDILLFDNNTIYLITIHLLALGVMTSFMLGALFQMLPVIAGVIIKVPTIKSMVAHSALVIGLLLQLIAFGTFNSILYLVSAIVLGSGLIYTSILMLKEIVKIKNHSNSSLGILFALGSFMIAILLGVYLLLTLGGYINGTFFIEIKEAHYSFALFGWVTLLVVSISFQVVEMFYVTPKFSPLLSRYLSIVIFLLLILKTVILFMGLNSTLLNIAIALIFIIYGSITIYMLYRRKRPTKDATVWFWRLGLGLLIFSSLIIIIYNIVGLDERIEGLSYFTFIGFVLSIVFAMVYKIVPFLVWFHLSNQGYMEAPMMFDVIHPQKAKIHFWIHISTLIAWSLSLLYQPIFILASILLSISFGWLLYHLIFALKKYNYTQKYTKKMEW